MALAARYYHHFFLADKKTKAKVKKSGQDGAACELWEGLDQVPDSKPRLLPCRQDHPVPIEVTFRAQTGRLRPRLVPTLSLAWVVP